MLHNVIMEFKALTYCKYYELFQLSDMQPNLLDQGLGLGLGLGPSEPKASEAGWGEKTMVRWGGRSSFTI